MVKYAVLVNTSAEPPEVVKIGAVDEVFAAFKALRNSSHPGSLEVLGKGGVLKRYKGPKVEEPEAPRRGRPRKNDGE